MDTPFPISFGAETTKLVMPLSALPESFAPFISSLPAEQLNARIKSLGTTAVYFPDKEFGLSLQNMNGNEPKLSLFGDRFNPVNASLIEQKLAQDLNMQAHIVLSVYIAVVIAASKTVPMHRITPTYRNKQSLAPREHNTYWIIDLREHATPIKTTAEYKEYLAAHTGKRLHSVRAHFRHYQNGLVSFVCQHVRGRGNKGKADKHINILEN